MKGQRHIKCDGLGHINSGGVAVEFEKHDLIVLEAFCDDGVNDVLYKAQFSMIGVVRIFRIIYYIVSDEWKTYLVKDAQVGMLIENSDDHW